MTDHNSLECGGSAMARPPRFTLPTPEQTEQAKAWAARCVEAHKENP